MANTEDYLDSLLNSINNTNMSGKKSKSYSGSDPYDNASEAFRKFEREQEYKREQRKKREEEQRFLQEFEGELEQEDVDDFLRQFELELAEEEENEANESVNTQSSVDENAGNVADAVSNAVENSTAGSVNAVYDLMMRHNFRIVRSVRIKIDHNLLANPGAKIENIREIYSHEQAISQCAHFLQGLPNVKVIRCENTAVAARMVAESGRDDVAALSSRACMNLYGLENLAASVQDQGNNFTRFICIAKDLEIYPGADRTSLMVVLPHRPGSLYQVLSRFYALGVNLNKLESRPIPERNFEFMFYFDLETSVYAPQFTQLMGELPELCEDFSYLGSYSEVI